MATAEQASQNLYVRVDVVQQLMLAIVNFLEEMRIQPSNLEEVRDKPAGASTGNQESQTGYSLNIQPGKAFTQKWPDRNDDEDLTDVQEGTAQYNGYTHKVKLGSTIRAVAGKNRVKIVVVIDGYPTVEFAGGDAEIGGNSRVASVIKINGKHLPSNSPVPTEYKGMPVGSYREVVDGPNASYGMAVICAQDDYQTMVKHALIRYTTPKEKA